MFSIRSHILFHQGVQIATVIQTEQDAVLAELGSNVPLLLEALANGAPALRPAYGQRITRTGGL